MELFNQRLELAIEDSARLTGSGWPRSRRRPEVMGRLVIALFLALAGGIALAGGYSVGDSQLGVAGLFLLITGLVCVVSALMQMPCKPAKRPNRPGGGRRHVR